MVSRTNLSVDAAACDEFSLQAQKQGKTLYAFTNETLSMMAKICAEGGTPAELYEMWHVVAVLRLVDVITLPADFVDDLIAELYHTNKALLLKKFSDLGSRLVMMLKVVADDVESLSRLGEDLRFIIPVKQFKVTKLQDKNSVQIEIIGAGRRMESTKCCAEFLKSILNGYGLRTVKEQVDVGTIRVIAQRTYESEHQTIGDSK